ncbi:MAG: hypothetical protein LLG01_00775 [Planctomycetaceae bacterium]|nr:hypothetical protein [Planctomycetaceae bacterium]
MSKEEQENLRGMLQELLDLESGLTDWEIEFLDSLNNWQGDFRPKQAETLQKIYDRRM